MLHTSRRICCALVLILGLIAAGCAVIRVEPADGPNILGAWTLTSFSNVSLSPRTRQTLRRLDLEKLYNTSPNEVPSKLHDLARKEPHPELLFALAEIYYIRGCQAEKKGNKDSFVSFYLSAGYAYHFLFDDTKEPGDLRPVNTDDQPVGRSGKIFDPRFRLACDLYNLGLAKCIIAAQRVGQFDPKKRLILPTRNGASAIQLAVVHHGFAFRPDEFGPVMLASDYQVQGLANHHRTFGLGVPLIGCRDPQGPRPPHEFYPDKVQFPVTAFFRFEGDLDALREHKAGWLELLNPLAHQNVVVKKRRVPLESDLTTPLAYYLAHAGLESAGYRGFFCPDSLGAAAGVHALEPYRPGKIPVVLVHGLLATPLTWAPMFNDLQADPIIRSRYQFWVYFYPTGNPYLATAAKLRQDLSRMREVLDPKHEDAALDDLVLVGHSMGGLVSRLLTVDGGDDFWKTASNVPLDDLRLQPVSREELSSTFYFKKQTYVRRAIFLATPHHGSRISPSVLGRFGSKLAGVPNAFLSVTNDLLEDNPELAAVLRKRPLPTSVDMLNPDSPALQLIANRPRPAAIHYNSVVGVMSGNTLLVERLFGGGYRQPSDGVVPYASAHLASAESEIVVAADHYHVHQHPIAILEVRRLLLEHLREFESRQPIQQVQQRSH